MCVNISKDNSQAGGLMRELLHVQHIFQGSPPTPTRQVRNMDLTKRSLFLIKHLKVARHSNGPLSGGHRAMNITLQIDPLFMPTLHKAQSFYLSSKACSLKKIHVTRRSDGECAQTYIMSCHPLASLIPSPHLLVLATTNERFLATSKGHFQSYNSR